MNNKLYFTYTQMILLYVMNSRDSSLIQFSPSNQVICGSCIAAVSHESSQLTMLSSWAFLQWNG